MPSLLLLERILTFSYGSRKLLGQEESLCALKQKFNLWTNGTYCRGWGEVKVVPTGRVLTPDVSVWRGVQFGGLGYAVRQGRDVVADEPSC